MDSSWEETAYQLEGQMKAGVAIVPVFAEIFRVPNLV